MIPELVDVFEATVSFIEESVADLSEQEMVEQPSGAPNHATWTLGHLIYSCQAMATELGAEPLLSEDWESVFGYGSKPRPDLEAYPAKAELLSLLTDSATRLRETLLAADETLPDQAIPDETFSTWGRLLLQVIVGHTAYHAGQLAALRRALGKPSVGVFV